MSQLKSRTTGRVQWAMLFNVSLSLLFLWPLLYSSSLGASHLFPTYLARCRQYLRSIPDSLCLEILENIFSLLLVTSADLHPEPHLPEDYAEEEDTEGKGSLGLRSPSESPQHIAPPERRSERGSLGGPRSLAHTVPSCPKAEPKDSSPGPPKHSFLDLKHFTSGLSGFLADEFAMGAFLGLIQEQLDEISSHSTPEETKLLEGQSCSAAGRDGLQGRLHRFSKVLSEAQWRYKVVTSNQGSGERREMELESLESRKGEKSRQPGQGAGTWEPHPNPGTMTSQSLVKTAPARFHKVPHHSWSPCLCLLFQKSSPPEDTGPLPQGTLVSAEVVGLEGPGQVIHKTLSPQVLSS